MSEQNIIIQNEEILSKINNGILKFYTQKDIQGLVRVKLLKVNNRPFSCVIFWEIRYGNNSRIIVSKKIKNHIINKAITSSKNQALVEFNILQKLYPKFLEIDGCSVPEPLFVMPEFDTYTMGYVPGELLVDQLRNCRYFTPSTRRKKLIERYYICGKWLKNFQFLTGIKKVKANKAIAGVIERLNHRLELICKKNDLRIPKQFAELVKHNVEKVVHELNNCWVTVSGRHSDFIPYNIIVNNHGICVIDFFGYDIEPLGVDLLKMMVSLHDERLSLSANPHIVDQMIEAFTKGYGKPVHQSRPVLYLCEAMQRMVSLWGNVSMDSKYIHHRIQQNRCIKSHLDWFFNNLDAPLLCEDEARKSYVRKFVM